MFWCIIYIKLKWENPFNKNNNYGKFHGSGSYIAEDGRTERGTDRQCQHNIPPPMAGDKKIQNFCDTFELHESIVVCQKLTQRIHKLTRKNAKPHDIIRTNVLTKIHLDWTENVTCRVLTRNKRYRNHFQTQPSFIKTINVSSRVVNINKRASKAQRTDLKNAPPPGDHVFQATGTIFELVQDIIGTNLLTKFHDDWTINMASRVLTKKNATPPWRPCFSANKTIFELIKDIIGTNLVTKFHDDRTINVASRVLIRKNDPPPNIIGPNLLTKVLTRKISPSPGGHIFQPTGIIF
ncbi:hypothetical protein DPMN_088734 [Dreissena polymorpha]|uniref:Uncharacterized protein n=1 Tax=Dreissena polymorpha TaxID=45954 RepID=A0A9D4QXD7_DREPO|nr:hypothetical protein DPMN_088734 [Dreissena polymorpha]